MNREELIRRLRGLPWPKEEYWLVAGGAMVLRGLRDETRDLDLGCSRELADRLEAEGCPVQRMADGSRRIVPGDGIELFEGWLCDRVESVDGIPVVSLRGLLQMKEALGREKDRADIAKIREALNGR